MKLKIFVLFFVSFLLSSNQALAKHGRCYGNLLATSDPSEIIEEHSDRVSVFLPLKIQVSDILLDCADEIWVEDTYYYSLVFTGPTEYKYPRLLDSQFNTMWAQNGIWRIPLSGRTTQMWVRLRHYSLFPAGNYTGSVKVSVVRKNRVIQEQYLNMSYYSEPQVAVSLDNASRGKVSGSNGHYQINLGELESNMRFYWGIKILSNSSYDIVLDSEYNGLRHETDTQALIDYSISFDNVKISSSERLIRSYNFFPGVRNKWFGFEFILGNTELMPAGYYRDNLSLTVYPK
ncbi:hypothetical protein [Pseudoalteromonas byunsanensis]|uniref:Uncharacterized protein n=1 Tax=Pseudoalteromonas byunsanensis TaxID=327939 RepID=A0A1S1N6Z5_9GAMM|nr:hypothetical protein [Pseudoalteromonas byunsanensis]OHU94031.1 hypothetical protein BIW53_17580 [Pseudoalteromonas byunsanensis]